MKSTPLWPEKVCAMAVTSLNQVLTLRSRSDGVADYRGHR